MTLEVIKYVVWVKEMGRAVAFYGGMFGLSVAFRSDNWSELKFGDCIVALHGGREDGNVDTGLSFQVSDIDETLERCVGLGGTLVESPTQRPGEHIILARIQDPDDNLLMVTQWVGQ